MSDERVDRANLYALVWSEPMSALAERFGLSDVGLAKLCKRHRIPVPGRGHWARVQAGQKAPKPPLPADKVGNQTLLLMPLSEQDRQQRAAERERDAAMRRSIPEPTIAAQLERLHPLAMAARKRLKQTDCESAPKRLRSAPEVLDIEVTAGAVERATAIAGAVLGALEQQGAQVRIDSERGRTCRWRPPGELAACGRRSVHAADAPLLTLQRVVGRSPDTPLIERM